MIAVICKNGHYFDLEKSETCPVCGAAPLKGLTKEDPNQKKTTSAALQTNAKKEKKGLFGSKFGKKKQINGELAGQEGSAQIIENMIKDDSEPSASEMNYFSSVNVPSNSEVKRVEGAIDEVFAETAEEPKAGVTHSYWETHEKKIDSELPSSHQEEQGGEPKRSAIEEEIRKAAADNSGKTVSYFSSVPKQGIQSGAASPVQSNLYGPVVGWIAAVKGPHFGEALSVYAGRNDVGRNESSKIPVTKDPKVSREKHGWIIYEPKARRFFMAPGDSSGIAYLNDEAIFETRELKAFDVVEFGDSRFVFVPLCGERFSWEDYIEKGE